MSTPHNIANRMYTEVMAITPELAMRWLESNTRNRPLDQKHVNYLCEEMKAGRWKLTHQGVAFDINSILQDGQHRLWAVALSGCTVTMSVTFNAPVDCVEYVDGGLARRQHHRMKLSGRFGNDVTKDHLAVLRMMVRGLEAPTKVPYCREVDLMRQHKPAVDFAIEHLATSRVRGVSSAAVRAAIARAWYSVDLEKLRRFCDVLRTGMADGAGESGIILLRDFVGGYERTRSASQMKEQYSRTERALTAFLAGKELTSLRPCQVEMFPLPNQKEQAA